jgi:hypothetical protein
MASGLSMNRATLKIGCNEEFQSQENKMKKSQYVQFLLTLFLGPFGLFYSNVAAAIGYLIAAIAGGLVIGAVGVIIVWIISIPTGYIMIGKYNELLEEAYQKHKALAKAENEASTAIETKATVENETSEANEIPTAKDKK